MPGLAASTCVGLPGSAYLVAHPGGVHHAEQGLEDAAARGDAHAFGDEGKTREVTLLDPGHGGVAQAAGEDDVPVPLA